MYPILVKLLSSMGHEHVGYIGEDGTGVTSEVMGHRHRLRIAGNEILVLPFTGNENHIHYAVPLLVNTRVSEQLNEDEKKQCVIDFCHAMSAADEWELPFRMQGVKNEDMYLNRHYTKDEVIERQKLGLPSNTANTITPALKILEGIFLGQMEQFKFIPTERGDIESANTISAFGIHRQQQSKFKAHRYMAFIDQLVPGRGILCVERDPFSNIDGDELLFRRGPWEDHYFAPHEALDMSDCAYHIKKSWKVVDEAKQLWPEIADELDDMVKNNVGQGLSSVPFPGSTTALYYQRMSDIDYVSVTEYEKRMIIDTVKINATDGSEFSIVSTKFTPEEIDQFRTLPMLSIKMKKTRRIVEYVFVGLNPVFYDKTNFTVFSAAPAFSTKIKNTISSPVEYSTGMQHEKNRKFNQTGAMAASLLWPETWIAAGALSDEELRKYKAHGAKPRFVGIYDTQKPEKSDTGRVPFELLTILDKDTAEIREILNVSTSLMGIQSNRESADAAAGNRSQNMLGNEFLFFNMRLCIELVARRFLESLHVYTPDRIARILMNNQSLQSLPIAPGKDGQQPIRLSNYRFEDIMDIMRRTQFEDYDVEVQVKPISETQRQELVSQLVSYFKSGLVTPEYANVWMTMILDLIDIPEKEKYIAMIQGTNETKKDQSNIQSTSEVVKVIAKTDPEYGKEFINQQTGQDLGMPQSLAPP